MGIKIILRAKHKNRKYMSNNSSSTNCWEREKKISYKKIKGIILSFGMALEGRRGFEKVAIKVKGVLEETF